MAILLKVLKREDTGVKKYKLESWTAAVVFTYLSLYGRAQGSTTPIQNPRKTLDALIPDDTEVWDAWKKAVVAKLTAKQPLYFAQEKWDLPTRDYNHSQVKVLDLLAKETMRACRGWERVNAKLSRS